ncbi:polysaccharide deacetylase family protein [Streptomyces pathocidini]|uniref:Polysaccharide deacetylase family protein n=1 Tax=Streptomyces pathocidini TaxID=1650571 RepID=A0ABW7UTK0_9ACTN|nr:polysaccharide deacetylase family protein [Streptomyces pathocidini]
MSAEPWLLMYHSVAAGTEDPYRTTVTPDRLRRQLRWMERRGLRGVGVGELLRERAAGRADRLVGLTFDDGYADFTENAVPVLHERGFTATVFVLPGRLGGDNAWARLGPRRPLLTTDGIREAAAAGMEIGSHGLRHVPLPEADEVPLRQETAHSRALLERITGHPVEGYCYPYGAVDARAIRAVREAGYAYACAVDPGLFTGTYALPRIRVGGRDGALRLTAKRLLHPVRRRALPAEADTPPLSSAVG